ncbi:protein NLRC3 [Boleophthalmus pectinirostris]|uniref:protein NLRC3 n=1 Tax=Boleophthalmus pectinirostris TaxID=150288 RepID=UPI00242AFC56|nr:protein NLRC3 [Boleophthalmus pectinirostris]
MEPNAEDDRYSDEEEERKKQQRPPSSYGSMKSDSEDFENTGASEADEDGQEENQCDQEVAGVFNLPAPVQEGTGVQINRPISPETEYTMTTMQTKPPGALVIETSSDIEQSLEDENEEIDEDDDNILITNSPEPPEPIEFELEQPMDIHGQPGKLHLEQDLPHVFKNIQKALTDLSKEELYKFKLNFHQRQSGFTLQQMFEGDLLDFVDRIIEMFGQDRSLLNTISTLDNITKTKEAEELRENCKKALIRSSLKQDIVRKYEYIFEGIPQPGKRSRLNEVYVEPEIVHYACGGVVSSHELRFPLQSPYQNGNADTLVSLNNLFRIQKPDGQPVRTVLTSGIAGIGMTVSVGKYCYDWAEHRANKDLQYVITLPFSSLWILRNRNLSGSNEMSIMSVIEYHHSLCKTKKYLDDEDCKFLIIMDSFDCYQTVLDWKNSPIIKENHTPAKVDDLIVNLIRGTLLPKAQVWILGRRAAVSQIPSEFIDAVTEVQGFNEQMKDDYLTRRFMGDKIVNHYKQLPTLCVMTRQPFICWMVSRIFGHNFGSKQDYGRHPPKLTPFYVNTLLIQTNRRLQFYYDKAENNLKWSDADREMLNNLGKMALKMLEQNSNVFVEENMKEHSLDFTDVTVFSGLCSELLPVSSGKRKFCFIHPTVKDFMAALYVYTAFRVESKNVLKQAPTFFTSSQQNKSAAEVVQCAINQTFNSPLGQYEMFLRFLCGLLSPNNNRLLSGNLYNRSNDKVIGKDVTALLERTLETCPQDRTENIRECLRELTQVDD